MIDFFAHLVGRYRSDGVLVDTNILLLFLVGLFDRTQIIRFKRTRAYSVEDYDLLAGLLSRFDRIVTTPHILSEVNSLARQLGEPARTSLFKFFATRIGLLTEEYVASAQAAGIAQFPRLGLTDSGIICLVKDKYLVLTDDFELFGHLEKAGIDVVNFNHLRSW
jgi:rRNA-processing protein FCF1